MAERQSVAEAEESAVEAEGQPAMLTEAEANGQITLLIERSISASIRGAMLLDLELVLKNSIDKGITVWLVPVGDKSKLRNLRGIQIKPESN